MTEHTTTPAAPRCPYCGMATSQAHFAMHVERFAAKHRITRADALCFLVRQATSLADHKRQVAAQERQAHLHRLWLMETTKETHDAP